MGTAPVNDKLQFALATAADDADLRRLLRDHPMPGRISLSLEREPDYFADADLPGETKQTIVARDGGRVICAGSCVVRRRFVNGEPLRVGYLGGLRLDQRHAGRFDILRRGYEFLRELQTDDPAAFYFTSIAADNERARKFLERGLPGMPKYELIGEFVTCLMPVQNFRRSRRKETLSKNSKSQVPNSESIQSLLTSTPTNEIVARLNEHNRRCQLGPCWTAEELAALQPLGLRTQDFLFVGKGGKVAGAAALWDQRAFKQTVVRGYAPWLERARPVLNLFARFTGELRLPAVGKTVAHAFVSHLAVAEDDREAFIALVQELRGVAAQRGIEFLTIGFDANDPRLTTWRKHFRGREYRSRLYIVRWPGIGGAANELQARLLAPEVALL
jgi:hypothetical protein